jgi:V/A-type H+-transporting ATPase subunit D
MPEIIEGVSPTRMQLLFLRRREKLAEKGHNLLREKRDALIAEFLSVVYEVRRERKEADAKLQEAFTYLILAQARLGVDELRQLSLMTPQEIALDFSSRSIMGVNVPIVELQGTLTRNAADRGYGFTDTSAAVDTCARAFEEALEKLVKLAELEEAVRNLAGEVEKTKRRVNALEYVMIPRLRTTRKYIQMRLAEMERENFTRLKKIKSMLEQKG